MAVDPSTVLAPILEDPSIEVVMHGADFDIRLLQRDLGIGLKGLFDTQIAATLLGARAFGLASLLEEHLGVKLSKKHQRADWAQRPLPEAFLEYAADDTRHLLALAEILSERLRSLGRDAWAEEEFRAQESIEWVEDSTDPVTRLKAARHMTPRQVTSLRTALAWRDEIARMRDRAPFRVVGDQVLLSIIGEQPEGVEELASLKGMSPRLARRHGGDLLRRLRAVDGLDESGLQPYPRPPQNGPGRATPEEEALMDAVRTLRSQRAEEIGLDKGVLLSNALITMIVRTMPDSLSALNDLPGVRAWQMELLGEDILSILGS
jgi:ribonuclease D